MDFGVERVWGMLGMLSRSMGGSSDDNLNYRCQSQHIPQGKILVSVPETRLVIILAKNVAAFALVLKL